VPATKTFIDHHSHSDPQPVSQASFLKVPVETSAGRVGAQFSAETALLNSGTASIRYLPRAIRPFLDPAQTLATAIGLVERCVPTRALAQLSKICIRPLCEIPKF